MLNIQFLFEQIQSDIVDALEKGDLLPGAKLPSENAYASKNGVSRFTVRKAYGVLEEKGILFRRKGSGSYVADTALDRVYEILRRKKYRIAVVLPEMNEQFFPLVRQGIHDAMMRYNCSSEQFRNLTKRNESEIINRIVEEKFDGVLFSPNRFRDSYGYKTFEKIERHGIPVTMIGKPPVNFFCDAVYYDDIHGAFGAVKDFYYYKYATVAHITNSAGDIQSVNERKEGYILGMEKYFPGVNPKIFDTEAWDFDAALLSWLKTVPLRIGVFLYDDTILKRVYPIFLESGRSIPKSLAVLGYNNYEEICNSFPIKFSSVHVPKIILGRRAFELLYKKMTNKALTEVRHILLNPNIIHRNSF
ncbi:MAG: GntR family transcriptional regulator [Clostridiales bacterium]|nr:GntR family transcriptional regulator [Clostridiales bacterium]